MEKRSESRDKLNEPIKYRVRHKSAYKTGLLMNISSDGALLWLKEDLSISSNLEVLLSSDDDLEHLCMFVVRIEETNRDGYTGYGCKIGMRISDAS